MELWYEEAGGEAREADFPRGRVGEILRRLDDYKRSFCGLSEGDNFYIQCAGSYESLIVEIRVPHGDGFRHYAIGHGPAAEGWSEQEREDNERFDAAEAEILFLSFLDTRDIPGTFSKRDMSDMFP